MSHDQAGRDLTLLAMRALSLFLADLAEEQLVGGRDPYEQQKRRELHRLTKPLSECQRFAERPVGDSDGSDGA